MTMTDPYDVTELTALANSLFPDLTEDLTYSPSGDVPDAGVPAVSAASIPAIEEDARVFESTSSMDPRGEVRTPPASGSLLTSDFDWEHPFAYGSAAEPPRSYAPTVQSKTEAAEADRRIDVPTSLQGADVETSGKESEKGTSRDDSIRIGSKTLAQIREDFPILSERINGNKLVWFDNGATTQRPRQVIDRLTYYYEHENSNVHRGAHTLAARSTDAYESARDIVRDFIGAPSSEEIIFVRGTTEAINLVANAYVKPQLQPGDEIIVSVAAHSAENRRGDQGHSV